MAAPGYRTRRYQAYAAWLRAEYPNVPCHWLCGRPATVPDHLIPLALGGTDEDLVPACAPCNGKRGSRLGRQLRAARKRARAELITGASRTW
jgi:5-methylcytosine-specific restriction endonuclease McrA